MKNLKYDIKTIYAVTKISLFSILRSPANLFLTLLFPIVFIAAFGFASKDNISIKLVVRDEANTYNYIYYALSEIPSIELHKESEYTDLTEDLKMGKVDGIINLTKFTEDKVVVKLDTTAAKPESGGTLLSLINGIIDKHNLEVIKEDNEVEVLPTQFGVNQVKGREYKTIDFILPGQLGFALMSIGVLGTANAIILLRSTLVLKRICVTPVKKSSILIGECLSRLFFAIIQCTLIILIGVLAFDFTLVHGFVSYLSVLFVASIGIITFIGMGFIIASVSQDNRTAESFSSLVTIPQFALSGTFFAIEIFPKSIRPISQLLPLTYLNNALRDIAFNGESILVNYKDIGVLILFGIVFYVIAIKKFKWE